MSDMYAGGLPGDGANMFPKAVSGSQEETQAYGGEEGIKTTRGGPAVNEGGNAGKDSFLNDANYDAGSMEAGRPGAMKVIDFNNPS